MTSPTHSDEHDTAAFYDALAPHYHLIFEDWNLSIERQGSALAKLLPPADRTPRTSVLDVACGIGTQALALAQRGYQVTASYVSGQAVDRARREAHTRALDVDFSVGDMRRAHDHHRKTFDAVVCLDNSLPHLLSDEDIALALRQFFLSTNPGGVCLISIRDYAAMTRQDLQLAPYPVHRVDGDLRILFQVWQWHGSQYDLNLYAVRDTGDPHCECDVHRARYYAISIARLMELMASSGFTNVRRIDDVYYQPVIIGIRATTP